MNTCVIITGAGGELGQQALASALDRPDVDHIIALTRGPQIDCDNTRCTSVTRADLTMASGISSLSAAVAANGTAHFGLLHCAGDFPVAGPLHSAGLDAVAKTFSANVLSFLGAVEAVVPTMRRVGRGGIVAFTSHTQAAAYPFLGAFNLSKAALLSAVQTLANENARFTIAANAIAIATLQTETERRIKPDGSYADWIPASEVAAYAIDLALAARPVVNGSEIQFWRHSDSFFGTSVFQRNSLDPARLDPDHD